MCQCNDGDDFREDHRGPVSPQEATPRVLVIPGLDGDPCLMQAAAPQLFPGMHVVSFEHRTDSMVGGVDGLAERALAALDGDGSSNPPTLVCGESFGGTVALTLARRYPARVHGLILLSAFGRYPLISPWTRWLGQRLSSGLGSLSAHRLFRFGRLFTLPSSLGLACSRELARLYLRRPLPHPPGYRAKWELSAGFDARPWLGSIGCPTFVLTGTFDPIVPVRAGRELARLIPNARLHRLAGGHLVHVTRSAEAGQLIAQWMQDSL